MFDDVHADSDPAELDRADPLRTFRARFAHDTRGLVYFDGNSLGRPPLAVREALLRTVDAEWTQELIGGWDHWIDLPRTVGDQLAGAVLGAEPGEVLVSDSTSVNLYKLAAAALDASPPSRRVVVTDDDNFPTDRYILQGLADRSGAQLRLIDTDVDGGVDVDRVAAAVGADTALVCLSHVAYRSGALADLAAVTDVVHSAGALMLWDLCHSAGVTQIQLAEHGVDLAVGCTYKYLNAGPGAPAFLYVRRDLQSQLRQPIWGWFSQRDQFAMDADYQPEDDVARFAVGTPSILGAAAVEAATSLTAEAGIDQIRRKSMRLGQYALARFDADLAPLGFRLASPRDPAARGGHLTMEHPQAWQISQAMRAAGVVPDYRTPNRVRLGFAPLYNTFDEVRVGFDRIRLLVESGAHDKYAATPSRVT